MAETMHKQQPRWPYFSNRGQCKVLLRNTMTSWKSQLQTQLLHRRLISNTGWIAMVLPDWLSCWAWSRGFNWNTRLSRMRRRFGRSSHQPTSQSWSSKSSRLGKTFEAWSYGTAEMSTTMHSGSIGTSTITISAQSQRPLTLTLPTPMQMQRQSPRWVGKSTSSTSFAGSHGMMSEKSSWSPWWTKMAECLPHPTILSPSLSKKKLQWREGFGSLQKPCSLQRRVAKVVVMAVKPVKVAKVQRGIREIIREKTIGNRTICGSAFIPIGKGISPRTAWASNTVILQSLPTLQQKHQLKHRLLWLSPLRSRPIGRWPVQMLQPGIGSSIADAQLTSPAVDQWSSPTLNILRNQRR